MSKLGILASVFALTVGTVACGNSQGQSNSLVDVGPSMVSSTSSEEGGGNLTTLARGGGGGGGKGSGGSGTTTPPGGSLSLVMVTDLNSNGAPNYGDTITFNLNTSASYPHVKVDCYQGTSVYHADAGFFAEYLWTKNFLLGHTSAWTSGAAACTATLYTSTDGIRTTTLATLNFDVGA